MMVGLFGIILPWQLGDVWLGSSIMLFYWPFAATSFVINVVVDAFAGERERHTLETLLASPLSDRGIFVGKYLAAVAHGVALVLINLTIGIVTVNLLHGDGTLLWWPGLRLPQILALTTLAAAFVAGLGVFVSLRAATVRQAHQTFGIALVLLFVTPSILLGIVSESDEQRLMAWVREVSVNALVWRIALMLLVVDVVMFLLARRRFRRGRLTLD
jgi:ABC-2 type transport system permease protein